MSGGGLFFNVWGWPRTCFITDISNKCLGVAWHNYDNRHVSKTCQGGPETFIITDILKQCLRVAWAGTFFEKCLGVAWDIYHNRHF